MTSERRQSLLLSRRESRNRHFSFEQIRNSSTPSSPLRTGLFGTTREAEAARNLASGLELLILFPTIKFNPIVRVECAEALACACKSPVSRVRLGFVYRHFCGTSPCLQCRKLRTANHVLACVLLSPGGATACGCAIGSRGRKAG